MKVKFLPRSIFSVSELTGSSLQMGHHTGRLGILEFRLKLVAGYSQFGSDYPGGGGGGRWGNWLLPAVYTANQQTAQTTILSGLNHRDQWGGGSGHIKPAAYFTEACWI